MLSDMVNTILLYTNNTKPNPARNLMVASESIRSRFDHCGLEASKLYLKIANTLCIPNNYSVMAT